MGYSVSYKIVGELEHKFKFSNNGINIEGDCNKYKTILTGTCIKAIKIKNTLEVYSTIYSSVFAYIYSIENKWKKELNDSLKDDNEVTLYGRGIIDGPNYTIDSYTYKLVNTLCNLVFYYSIKFGKDISDDDFYSIVNTIEEELLVAEDIIYEILDHELLVAYKDKEGSEFSESY